MISLQELLTTAQVQVAVTFRYAEFYTAALVYYLVIVSAVMALQHSIAILVHGGAGLVHVLFSRPGSQATGKLVHALPSRAESDVIQVPVQYSVCCPGFHVHRCFL